MEHFGNLREVASPLLKVRAHTLEFCIQPKQIMDSRGCTICLSPWGSIDPKFSAPAAESTAFSHTVLSGVLDST